MAPEARNQIRGFVHVTAEDAKTRTAPQKPRLLFTSIPVLHLELSKDQLSAIQLLSREQDGVLEEEYRGDTEVDQIRAASILAANQLDIDARECAKNKWVIKWVGSGAANVKRVLYQWCVPLVPQLSRDS